MRDEQKNRAGDRGATRRQDDDRRPRTRQRDGKETGKNPRQVPLTDEQREILNRKRAEREAEKRLLLSTNREITVLCVVIFLCFLGTIGYLCYFMTRKADAYKNSGYNAKRQALLEERFTRGDIVSSDGTLLATTKTDDDGDEYRYYPEGCTYAHVVGSVNNGVSGLESSGGSYLLQSHESLLTQIMNEIQGVKTVGDTVHTTLDAVVQQEAHDALGNRKGAVVVMDVTSGDILAMVSKLDYDPNDTSVVIDELEDGTLMNKATQGLYTPGSTFKILTALEYMRENPNSWESFRYTCDGEYELEGNKIHCYGGAVHGEVSLEDAMAYSCNGAFAKMGQSLNYSKFHDLCTKMGFNQNISNSSLKMSVFSLDNSNNIDEVLQTSIGQGKTQITPVLNCMIAAAVANDGVMMKPRLIDSIDSASGTRIRSIGTSAYGTVMTSQEASDLERLMRVVCEYGTGTEAAGSGYTVYGKTGSAEIGSDIETNAWFIGYAVSDSDPNRKLAISVVVEEGGSGGSTAAPIARRVFEAAFHS